MSHTSGNFSAKESLSSANFSLRTIDDIDKEPAETWQVSDVLISQGLACIYGESGTGKTFLALDLALSICTGKEWFGHTTHQAPVTYLYLESSQGIKKRMNAWKNHNQHFLLQNFHFMTEQIDISSTASIDELSQLLNRTNKSRGVIVIDTLSAATSGMDENSSRDMGKVISNLKTLSFGTKCLVILIHHSGKNSEKGLRGHSSLFAAADSIIKVNSESFRIEKNKDGEKNQGYKFKLTPIDLGQGVTSCAVTSIPQSDKPLFSVGKNQEVILTALKHHWNSTDVLYLSIEDAVSATYHALTEVAQNKKKYEAKTIINKLIEKGLISTQKIDGVECILSPDYPVQTPSPPLGGGEVWTIQGIAWNS